MKKITEKVSYFGSYDTDRRLFDQLVPTPEGTTYNNYLIEGSEKTALIDTVYPPRVPELIEKLKKHNIKIDYIIANHGEQDHSGGIPKLLELYPDAYVITNKNVAANINSMLNVPYDKIKIIEDQEQLSLGDKTLRFILAPFVHWPDTMFTYLEEDKMLFTCDFLGAHYTSSDIFADYTDNLIKAARRYYSEIIMPFRLFAADYVKKVKELDPKFLLPSHGPIYNKPDFILDLYSEWTSDKVKPIVLIPYVSMYESTKMMVDYLAKKLKEKGMEPKVFDLVGNDLGELASDLVDASTVILGTSMVLAGPHPQSVCAAYLINILRPKIKAFGIIGSYGWGGNLSGVIDKIITIIKPKKLDNVIIKGVPKEEDYKKLDTLVEEITNIPT